MVGTRAVTMPQWNSPARVQNRGSAVDLAHAVHVNAPAVADNLSHVRDLPAGLGIEWRFAQQHGDAVSLHATNGGDVGANFDRVIADETRLGGFLQTLPSRQLAE